MNYESAFKAQLADLASRVTAISNTTPVPVRLEPGQSLIDATMAALDRNAAAAISAAMGRPPAASASTAGTTAPAADVIDVTAREVTPAPDEAS